MPWVNNTSRKREKNRKETEKEGPVKQKERQNCCSGSREIQRNDGSNAADQSLSKMGAGNSPLDLALWWSWVFSGDSVC